jgi:hypothetical protein
MQNRLISVGVAGLLLLSRPAAAQENFVSPAHLSEISQSWAYSLAQDRDGAM